jgi:undecaprenyl-diphosphatase
MTLFQAFILGLVQGITEFFPVSSSAHLQLVRNLLKLPDQNWLFFDLSCHAGTLLVLMLYLRRDVISVFTEKQRFLQAFFALLPLPFCYAILHFGFKNFYTQIPLGFFLIMTGLILFIGIFSREKKDSKKISDMLFIGVMQGLALMPGISRSGMTISGAHIRGWSTHEAVRFSFLLAIPTILGGFIVEFLQSSPQTSLNFSIYLVGFFTSFITGLFFVKIIFSLTKRIQFLPFAIYCILIGLLVQLWAK